MNRIKSVFVRNLVSGSLDTDSGRGSIIPTRIYHHFATRANEDNGWNGETKGEIHPREGEVVARREYSNEIV